MGVQRSIFVGGSGKAVDGSMNLSRVSTRRYRIRRTDVEEGWGRGISLVEGWIFSGMQIDGCCNRKSGVSYYEECC